MIEIDVWTNRCGVRSGDAALLLAERIAAASHLRFRGLQAYHGRAQHVRMHAERAAAIEQSIRATRNTVDLLARNGFACRVVSGGGTGSYEFELASGVYNELQPGSYIFMDADYGRNLDANGQAVSQFCQSLFVYTQVMSVPGADYAGGDAGLKALAFDSGMPRVADMPDVTYQRPSDEHGILDIRSLSGGLRLGAKLRLIPGHCDPTVNLYDWFVAIRGNRVEALWPIVARGALS
jgi:3-hydroxy-D-aspartate aldolase